MRHLGALLSLVVAMAGCSGGADDGRRTVVAAFYPLAWIAEQVAGDDVRVENLTPAGVEPHDLELTAKDIEALEDADLVLFLGGGFMPALEDAIEDDDAAVDLLEGQKLRKGEDSRRGDQGEGEAASQLDPHVWLDPLRLAEIARTVAEALGDAADADPVVSRLRQLHGDFRAGLARCERNHIVTSHAAFSYLADAYGLEQISISGLSPEAEPSPRTLERLVEAVEQSGATTVFFETLVSPRLAETVAREAGVRAAALDPLEGLSEDDLASGADYLSVMRENLGVLRKALGCR